MLQSSVIDQKITENVKFGLLWLLLRQKTVLVNHNYFFWLDPPYTLNHNYGFCGGTIEYSKKKTVLAFLNVDLFPYSTKMLRKGHCTTFT